MDWLPVISVQQQTPDNDFCHFSISNVRFTFWAFFRKPEKLGSHTGSKWFQSRRGMAISHACEKYSERSAGSRDSRMETRGRTRPIALRTFPANAVGNKALAPDAPRHPLMIERRTRLIALAAVQDTMQQMQCSRGVSRSQRCGDVAACMHDWSSTSVYSTACA